MLTGPHIEAALRAAGARTTGLVMPAADIAAAFNDAMLTYGVGQFDTIAKVAALVSESMMESAYFHTTVEYNTTKGGYQPYRGRTFIQITWKANYQAFGAWCKSKSLVADADYFVKNPSRLADLKWAAIGPVWYFTQVPFSGEPLTAYAGDIAKVGKAVNLGSPYAKGTPNGQGARAAAYLAVRGLGDVIIPKEPDMPLSDADVNRIADAVLTRDGQIPNVFTGNTANEYVALTTALSAIGKQLDAISTALATSHAPTPAVKKQQ
jgi:hypothetical protein